MNRTLTLVAISLTLACGLWLAMSLSTGGGTPVVGALPELAQLGEHTVAFRRDVSPAGYDGAADTVMEFYNQAQNEGGRVDFGVTFDDKKRPLVRFDLSQHIPQGAQVLSATLTLRVKSRTASSRMGLLCYQVLQEWAEDQATWRQAQEGVEWWGGAGCEGSSRSETPICQVDVNQPTGGSVALDLRTVVQEWVENPEDNHGVLLQGQQTGGRVTYYFGSSEHHSPDYRPRLLVVYEGAPPLATPTPTLAPTRTPTPPNPTVITSTLADWKFDSCLKTGKSPPRVRVAGPETMLIMWEGVPYTAKLRVIICNSNAVGHSIYLNGHRIGYTPLTGSGSCECNDGTNQDDKLFEYEINPGLVVQGANYITTTNEADAYDEWKASRAHIVMIGNITGTTRSYFVAGHEYDGRPLHGATQLPIRYEPGVATPLLISVPGTGEDKDDALNRYAIRANDMGWLLASLDLRKGWNSYSAKLARSPSLAVQGDVMALLQHMQANFDVDPSRIYIAGFSVGGGIAATVAAKYPDVFAGVVDYAGPTDYAAWYRERGDIRLELEREFFGGPGWNFEYPRRSSLLLARNLQYVPMRTVHGMADDRVLSTHSQGLYEAMAQVYDPNQHDKEWITHTLGHVDFVEGVSEDDLEFLAQYSTSSTSPRELRVITDEGKDYYWLHVAKMDTADDAWHGWVEVSAGYDPGTNAIWVTAGDGHFAEGKPLTVTLDLMKMDLSAASAYDVEEYDGRTGEFSLHSALVPAEGKLILAVPRNVLGSVGRQYVIYPASGREVQQLRLQQNLDGYVGARDTYITSYEPEVSHGAADQLLLSYDGRRKALLEFDLSPVPDGVIVKAARLTFHLLQDRSVGVNVGAYKALRPWQDSDATWQLASQVQSWAVPGADGLGSDRADTAHEIVEKVESAGPYSFNLKSLVQSWLAAPDSNHGLVLIGEGSYASSSYPLASAENGDTGKRPLLEIWCMEPTPVPTVTPTPTACTIEGSVTLQGRRAPPDTSWSVPLTVTVGSTSYAVATDQWGKFTLFGLTPGTYDIRVKNSHTLRNLKSGVALVAGPNPVDFGALLEGDANDDNAVNIKDFSILSTGFYPTYDARADFNEDGYINISDFSLLVTNFGWYGDITVAPAAQMQVSPATGGSQ
jgi:pimeloyl-ACP methyl ester carboxylesterase